MATVLIVCLAIWVVYRQVTVHHQKLFDKVYWKELSHNNPKAFSWLALVCVLMLLNWGLEALKWKVTIKEVREISFGEAYRGVLCGLGLSLFSPRFIGEGIGRILHLSGEHREKAISALLISRLGQLYVTLSIGVISMLFYTTIISHQSAYVVASIAILCIMTLAVLQRKNLVNWLTSILTPKVEAYLLSFKQSSTRVLFDVFCLSLLRYGVFLFQFLLVFYALEGQIPWVNYAIAIAVFFLVRSMMVSVNLFLDYAVRLSSAIVVLNNTVEDTENIVVTISLVWLINVMLPSLIGSLFIRNIKWRTT